MILAVDIGNTTIGYYGLERKQFSDYEICFCFKIDSRSYEGKEEFLQELKAKLEEGNSLEERKARITGIAISSVVPGLTDMVCQGLKELFNLEPYRITWKAELGLTLAVEEPDKLGNDRLCDAVMAAATYDLPVITVDLGTATTFNVIDKNGHFLGGAIMPGLETGFRALTERAAQLQSFPLSIPEQFIGRNTSQCMNIGVVAGMAGAVDGMVKRMEQELGEQATLVLTGGLAKLVSPLITHAHSLDPDLLAKGMAYLYERRNILA